MSSQTHRLAGSLVSRSLPTLALRVEAWDAEGICPDLIDVAVADARGAFEMRVDPANLAELLPRKRPAVVFRVFDGSGQAVPLAQKVVWTITESVTRLQIPLGTGGAGAGTAVRVAPLVVRGTVRRADGSPMPNVMVRAFDRSVGRGGFQDTPLGADAVDAEGRYEIQYAMPAGGKVKPDLIVRAVPQGEEGDTRPAPGPRATARRRLESALISPAPATARVDLGGGAAARPTPSEFRKLMARVAPVLERGGVAVADLDPAAIAHTAQTAGVPAARLRMARDAALLEREADGAVPTEILYGLLRTGQRRHRNEFASAPMPVQRRRLQRAMEKHIISPTFADRLDEILLSLRGAIVERALPQKAGESTCISTALAHSLSNREAQGAFVSRWMARPRDMRAFWSSIKKDPAISPAAEDIELTLRLGALFKNHRPALTELRAQRQAGRLKSLRDVARWEDADWAAFLARSGAPGTRGRPEERARDYRGAVQRELARLYPTETLRRNARRPRDPIALRWLPALLAANPGLDPKQPLPTEPAWGDIPAADRKSARGEWTAFRAEALSFRHLPSGTLLEAMRANGGRNPARETASRILVDATDLDLEVEGVEAYLTRKPAVLAAVPAAQRGPVIDHLKTTQRLLRVTQQPGAVETLMADGLDSAFRIARLSRASFIERYSTALGGETEANRAYTRSRHTAAVAQLALTTVSQALLDHSPAAVRGYQPETRRDYGSVVDIFKKKAVPQATPESSDDTTAAWPVLFGEQAWCACEHCQSVYSPAAYFVDLLYMLDDDSGHPPANVLFRRRPDLKHLKLSCENTNTTIPCIDLVNEILETYIDADVQDKPALRARSRDTGDLTAEELRAAPQFVNDRVYARLAREVYPFTLPFHRPLAVVRAYLDQLGTSYRDILEAFGPEDADGRIAAETLGLSTLEASLVAGADTAPDTPAGYGFDAQATPNWPAKLADVPELLRRTGASYEELIELVKTYFVNPSQHDEARRVELEAPDQCVIEGTRVLRATAETWSRLHRFIRLQRATGWSIADLDRALFAVALDDQGMPQLGFPALRRLASVKRAVDKLGRPLASLLSLWSDLDTWNDDALYLKLFRNRTVLRGDDADVFELAYLDAEEPDLKPEGGRNELTGTGALLADHVATVIAALRIAEADLDLIWAHAEEQQALAGRDVQALSVHALSVLYRYTVLAKGLGLRIDDLIVLMRLIRADPFEAGRPGATLTFLEQADVVKESGLSIATLDYLYRHTVNPAEGPAPADSQVFQALMKVWEALRAVRQETEVDDDPNGQLLRARLGLLHPSEIVESILDALDPAQGIDDAIRARVFDDYLSDYLGGQEQALLAPPVPATEEEMAQRRRDNQAHVLTQLSAWLRDSLSRSAVATTVAESLGLADALTRRLLEEWIPGDPTALDTFLGLAGGGLTAEAFAAPAFAGTPATSVAESITVSVTNAGTPRSVRWSGQLLPLGEGEHVFVLRTDGAVTLRIDQQTFSWPSPEIVDGQPIVVDRTPDTAVTLAADTLASIQIEWDAGAEAGRFELLWKLASSPAAAPVAAEYLFPAEIILDDPAAGPGFTWRMLHKAALLITGLGFTEEELDYSEGTGNLAGFRLRQLPMEAPAHPEAHMRRWLELARYAAVRSSLPNAETTLAGLFQERSPAPDPSLPPDDQVALYVTHWATRLSDASGWDAAAVESLFSPGALDPPEWRHRRGDQILARLLTRVAGPLPQSGELEMGRRLAALATCLDLVRRTGAAAHPTLRQWARQEPDAGVAREVVEAVRGRYEEESQWLEVARTRNDPLREAQRDALIAYLLPRMEIQGRPPRDADELFEWFLIDVQMAACFQTSRIKQAISSVQLFVHRCLLGLEKPDVEPTFLDPEDWQWKSRYRVWEANRKIFIYPENWIEPELRDNKSPFFEELEAALRQGPLEEAEVEDAFLAYLEHLDDVARLKICALHWQTEIDEEDADKSIDILHVVARSASVPPVFYYRTLVNGSEWTPWDKIDLDIETSDHGNVHMVLTTHERRLYLFWALFAEEPEDDQPGSSEGDSPPPPLTHWEIRMAWATCRDGKWSAKQESTAALVSERFDTDKWEKYQDLVDEAESKEQAKDTAEERVADKEDELWTLLQKLRSELWARIEFMVTSAGTVDADDVNDTIYKALAPLFYYEPENVPELEDWIDDQDMDFEEFLDNIHDWPPKDLANQANLDEDDLPSFTVKRGDVTDLYDSVLQRRTTLENAKDSYNEAKDAMEDYASTTSMAFPGKRERRDYSFWRTSATEEVVISVLLHTDSDGSQKIGTFTLSTDGHSMGVDEFDKPRDKDLTDVTPRHAEPRFTGFKVADSGLDLKELPNLLARVTDLTFTAEQCYSAHVTGSSPRPFFIAQDSDCHVALAAPEPAVAHGFESARDGRLGIGTTTAQTFELTGPGSMSPIDTVPDRIVPVESSPTYLFEAFHHPFVGRFIKRLRRDGLDGLLSVDAQNPAGDDLGEAGGHFDKLFKPSDDVDEPYAGHCVDFRAQGAYSLYNWELFFHAPLLIAIRLMQDRRYEEARDWLHYIFDPTADGATNAPKRFWKVKPFRQNDDLASAEALLTALADPSASATLKAEVLAQIDQWERYPANPHRIAALRLSAYQKAVVFRYLDNLIAWGDSLFTQDTIESINEATQLYVFASHLLGPRPEHVPQLVELRPRTYAFLRDNLDELANMLVDVESLVVPFASSGGADYGQISSVLGISHLPVVKPVVKEHLWATWEAEGTPRPAGDEDDDPPQQLYFCVPGNDKLLGYWDTVDDRLFKIRHCMNIAGVERQLPLFEPPIDPALLVRAAAAGLDIGSVLSDLSAPLPNHRFPMMLQKALELCNEVKSLGSQLSAALEKRDAEKIAVLRATHEKSMVTAVREVRAQQLAEAKAARIAIEKQRKIAEARQEFYGSRELTNTWEAAQLAGMQTASSLQLASGLMSLGASAAAIIPEFDIGPTGMGVHGTAAMGGKAVSTMLGFMAQEVNIAAGAASSAAAISGITGGHQRRMDEWKHQENLAGRELAQIDQQLVSTDIKIAVATLEQANHEKQIDNAIEMEEVLRTKYSNQELYSWMISRISEVYYQAYKLAYDMAKRAERCYRFETGKESSSFIQFGYWDSLRKGLYAGEQLALDLKRLDVAYLEAARRDYEITRQVSLVLHDPSAFMLLRETGTCTVELPEELFDADYPGHYFRRLKTVSLTLPCVAGPYTPINCTLTLLSSRVRISSSSAGGYPEHDAPNDTRFSRNFGVIQSVATSHGQNDAGLFEVNFHDERYLPFEGAGAVSRWRIDLPKDCNAFDFDTLSDAILRLSYTARDGGKPLATKAKESLRSRRLTRSEDAEEGTTATTPLRRLLRVRYEFSDPWIAFRNGLAAGSAPLELVLDQERFPFLFRAARISITEIQAYLTLTAKLTPAQLGLAAFDVTLPTGATVTPRRQFATTSDETLLAVNLWSGDQGPGAAPWRLTAPAGFPVETMKDLVLVVTYTAETPK